MKTYYTDLHIHSALSPCASEDMTPNNIVNMSMLKGLDIIAVTDHNSCRNLPAVMQCAKDSEILVVPGMEVETQEEIHVVTLFRELDSCIKMSDIIKDALLPMKNNIDIFGRQQVFDHNDNVVDEEEQMLITAARISIEELVAKVNELSGVAVPAHIDRGSYSIISNLGFISEDLGFKSAEISKDANPEELLLKHKYLSNYNIIRSSDAHYLGDILEREFCISLKEKSADVLIDFLKNNSHQSFN